MAKQSIGLGSTANDGTGDSRYVSVVIRSTIILTKFTQHMVMVQH